LDTLEPIPSTTLFSAQEAKDRLREIVEGFFFRRLTAGDGKRVGRLLIKSPAGLGKTREAIHWAIHYQAAQEGKDGASLSVGDFNEAGVPAQTSIFIPRHHLAEELRGVIRSPRSAGSPPAISQARRHFRCCKGWSAIKRHGVHLDLSAPHIRPPPSEWL
jgi:hypothetical protein